MVQHQVKEYFPNVPKVTFEGQQTKSALAFREYNASEVVLGKTMEEWCRFAVCYWHTFGNTGGDPFGGETYTNRGWNEALLDSANLSPRERLLEAAKCRADAAFEVFTKLGVKFYTFHDVDLVSEGASLDESQSLLDDISDYLLEKQNQTGVKCLWGTTNLFGHRRFMNGASTNPDMKVFAHAAARVKKAMEITLKLGGQNFVFWGGREGFQSILNTDMKMELDHMAAFFKLVVAYKKELGATFQFLHQYDYDAATVIAFLHTYGLQNDFKLNIEPNHTTLAGHDYEHDIYYAASYKMLGSVDCNTGDPLVGWDTDQFLMDEKKAVLVMKKIVEIGGLAPGGLNFDAKAAKLLEKNELGEMVKQRYASWKSALGERIEDGRATLEEVAAYAKESGEPDHVSGKQELAELLLFRGVQ
ncbi:Xylose isomerase [Phytophthora fragariae]|uniref:Xylose isomerase n=1 Tax=Phytophthora fragariae TaxID=53985 RepID=A0A6A3H1N0_9STRA|nr:Xylose isomerase [Phytophthora fragariae]